jgi:MFS family permease
MGLSYAGDRLQEMAQAWLVASLTHSALAVGGIGMVAALPQLFILVGGAIGDRLDRRRLLIGAQLAGAALASVITLLVFSERVKIWNIYAWALASGVVWLFSRPRSVT